MSDIQAEVPGDRRVRVHIDQERHDSPNPTTGAALYALAGIHEGLDLFREVEGDREDEPIARTEREIRLVQDEHFHSGKDRKYRIIVNLEEKIVDRRVLTFREVVKIAFPDVKDGPGVVYTVTYKKAAGPQREGTLAEGQHVEVKNGTIFSVTRTDKS
jgi:multiubiquitin